jgi:hypothetical protein
MWCTADRRNAQAPGQRAAEGGAHQQRAEQPGPGGVGYGVQVGQALVRLAEHLLDQRNQLAHVVAGGELRHHAAVVGVQFHLAVQRVGQQPALGVVQRHTGFVAGGFDAQDQHGVMVTRHGCLRNLRLLQSAGIASRIRRLQRPRAGLRGWRALNTLKSLTLSRRCQA